MAGWGLDTRDFNKMAKGLREAKPELAKELKKALRAAGEITAAEARLVSSEHSRTIPATVKTSVRGTRVEVRAGGPAVPIAGLYEYGNRAKASGNTFRHPVFGDRTNWVEQKRYPFMRPAVERTRRAAEAEMLKALDAVSRKMVE
jgi:hypothetical protein